MKSRGTSGGNARKKSTYALRKRLSHFRCRGYSIATVSPLKTPRGTMTRDRSAVISMPRSRNGQERSRIAPLKNTWMIWSTLALPGEAGLDPAARDDHRQEQDQIGKRAQRERRRVARLARAGGRVV